MATTFVEGVSAIRIPSHDGTLVSQRFVATEEGCLPFGSHPFDNDGEKFFGGLSTFRRDGVF